MSSFLTIPLLWAQAGAADAAGAGDPAGDSQEPCSGFSSPASRRSRCPAWLGGLLTWLKAIGLLCLVGWLGSWLVTAIKERVVGRGKWYDYVAVAALILTPRHGAWSRCSQTVKEIPAWTMGQTPLVAVLGFLRRGLVPDLDRGRPSGGRSGGSAVSRPARAAGHPPGPGLGHRRGL